MELVLFELCAGLPPDLILVYDPVNLEESFLLKSLPAFKDKVYLSNFDLGIIPLSLALEKLTL
ncbi:hypothetical protein D3C71_2169240 [compost metagenome]